jgi:hypothetical protein
MARNALLARIHPADAASVLQAIQTAANTGNTIEMQLRVMGRADEVRWISIQARSKRDANGNVRSVTGSTSNCETLRTGVRRAIPRAEYVS